MSRFIAAALACLVLIPAGCRSVPDAGAEPGAAAAASAPAATVAPPEYPRSYRGASLQLNLFDDGSYFLARRDPADAGGDFDDIGRWLLAEHGEVLQLEGGGTGSRRFALHPDGSLEPLDGAGKAVAPGPTDDLRRDPAFVALEPSLSLRGEFTYFADSARFRDCGTGAAWPVAMEAAYPKLEQAYGESGTEPGKPLLTVLKGRLAQRPRAEAGGLEVAVVVEHLIRVVPGQACAATGN